jgi:hypothetical protein
MPLYTFLHSLLNVLVQIANKMGLQKNHKQGEGNWNQMQMSQNKTQKVGNCDSELQPEDHKWPTGMHDNPFTESCGIKYMNKGLECVNI